MMFSLALHLLLMSCNIHSLRIAHDKPGLRTFEGIDGAFAKAFHKDTDHQFHKSVGGDSKELPSMLHQSNMPGAHMTWITKMGEHCQSNQTAHYFPTVPRSGNTWSRLLLEQATGIVTSSIFENELCSLHKKCACGISNDCPRVRQPFLNESHVLKAHYPFFSTLDGSNLTPPIQHALLTIRNPVDNYLAWKRYYRHQGLAFEKQWPVRVFLDSWVNHFTYWFAKAQTSCMQVTLVRFEDLTHATKDVLSTMTSTLGYSNANFEKALGNYPPDPQKISNHLFSNRDLIARSDPMIRDLAQLALSDYGEVLKELGYHEFVALVANSSA